MEKRVILSSGNYTLLERVGKEFVVASGYDETQPEGSQWDHGTYFTYWGYEADKARCLANAIDFFRMRTEENYIPRERLENLAMSFKNCCRKEENFDEVVYCMADHERDFFELEKIEETDLL